MILSRKYFLIVVGFFICFKGFSQLPSQGLVAFYPFNGNANDASGNGNNGVVRGASLAPDRCGSPDSAYNFDGLNDYIELPFEDFILDEYTYSVWIRVDELPPEYIDGWIVFSPGSASSGLCQGIGLHPEGGICATSYNIGENPRGSWAESPGINSGEWVHVVTTRDREKLQVFINGVLMPYVETDRYMPYTNNQDANYGYPNTRVIIGCRSNMSGEYFFDGSIDDLAVYNRVLTPEEIRQLYFTVCNDTYEINGKLDVCQNEQDVAYSLPYLENVTYDWSYSGTGATISGNSNEIQIDFSIEATSGFLNALITEADSTVRNITLSINVGELPYPAAEIAGNHELCANSTLAAFSVPLITNAFEYKWNYTGTGFSINGNTNQEIASIISSPTNGNLTVYGINHCGRGESSPEFPIIVKPCSSVDTEMKIPNSFSPNGDNINELFFIQGLKENTRVKIFNRNGKLIYENNNYKNDWGGSDEEGNKVNTDTYWYIINIPGIDNELKGFLYIKI